MVEAKSAALERIADVDPSDPAQAGRKAHRHADVFPGLGDQCRHMPHRLRRARHDRRPTARGAEHLPESFPVAVLNRPAVALPQDVQPARIETGFSQTYVRLGNSPLRIGSAREPRHTRCEQPDRASLGV
ncbi:MAG TPA: hypothetical protein ENJ62_06365, partial [Bryobacterales bacterium]|nr:hypothetical protein [Bryobacterales bacterium]